MTLKDDIAEACATHDMYTVLGLPSRKKVILCPLPTHIHKSNTPSFSIFWNKGRQWWRCHGMCHQEGDIVDLIGYLRVPGYQKGNATYQRQALALLDERYEAQVVLPEKEVGLSGSAWLDFLPPGPEVIEYARTRGLTPETLKRFNIGQSKNFMTMPCFEDHKLLGVKLRNTREGMRFFQLKGSRQGLFNFDSVYLRRGTVFVVKGEIPCMLLDQLGFPACAPTGGEGGWSERWRTCLAFASKVVIGDNDDAGRMLGKARAGLLDAALVFPDEKYKDIDQWLLEEPEQALHALNHWNSVYSERW